MASSDEGRTWVRRVARGYRAVAILLLNLVVLLVVAEIGARLLQRLVPALRPDAAQRRTFVSYAGQEWAPAYWREFWRSHPVLYRPWVIWRRPPFAGTMIHVDAEGLRVTPGAQCGPGAFTVFTFGGSTMWGTGAADGQTIAADLQEMLRARLKRPICVKNFGETGYTSTQEVVQLMLRLRAGERPDLVIFYDGVNDVAAGYESGRAGAHINLRPIADRFAGVGDASLGSRLLRSSAWFSLFRRYFAAHPHGPPVSYRSLGVDAPSLGRAVVDTYLAQRRLVAALAREYGFRAAFFWQPVIMVGAKPFTREERRIDRAIDPAKRDLYAATYRFMSEAVRRAPDLYDVSGVFDGIHAPVWIDPFHVTPLGDELVARAMLAALEPQLSAAPAGDADRSPK